MPGLIGDRAETIRRIAAAHGPVVRVPVPGKPFHLVSCPRLARHVLLTNNKNYRKSFDWKIVHSLLGDGLVTSHDEVWRHARAATAPVFRQEPVLRMAAALQDVVAEEVAGWGARDGVLPTGAATTRLALRAFARAALDVDADRVDLDEITRAVSAGLRHLDARLGAPVDLAARLPTPGRLRFARARARLDAVLYRWIDAAARRAPGPDLLSVLLQASRALPDPGLAPRVWLRDQLVTFLLAGHETVAVSLTWCLHLLATHPDAQRRAREGLPGDGEALNPWLGAWTPLDAVIHEALRLFPPVWSLGREAVADDRLGDFHLPAGATVMVSPYAIHRRADLWPEPDAFRPERFAAGPPPQGGAEGLTYLPFSAGPRLCPGDRLALVELKLALREVLRRFEVAPTRPGPVACEALISLRPRRELELRLTARAAGDPA